MKIKNSVKSISPDISILLMCFAILVVCPLRIYQMLKNMDPATGFFNDYMNITVIAMYAVLVVATVLMLILPFLSGRIPAAVAPKGRRIPLGIASALIAGALFYDALTSYITDDTTITDTDSGAAILVQNTESISLLSHLHAIFAFISCCYFVVMFISYITGHSFHKKLKLLALAPLAWTVVSLLERLIIVISILRVSDLLLEICGHVFLLLFFLSFARVASEVNEKGSMWSLISCGTIASMFILTYSIPRLMLMFTGNADKIVADHALNIGDVGCVLFIIVFIVTTLRCGYKVEDVKEMQEEIAAAQEEMDETEEVPEILPAADESGNIRISADRQSGEDSAE